MSTVHNETTVPKESEARSQRVTPAVGKQHKKLAPKATVSQLERPHDKASSSASSRGQSSTPDRKKSPSPKFAFINTTSDVQYSGPGDRTVARSHVMRNFHRQKGKGRVEPALEQAAIPSRQPVSTPQTQRVAISSTRFPDLMEVDDQWEPALRGLEGDIKHDSAEALNEQTDSALWLPLQESQWTLELPMTNLWSFPIDAHSCELIYHYTQIFARTFVPMNESWEVEWFKNVLNDPACYHGTLFLASAHRALLNGTQDSLPLECFQHKGEAIRIINDRLNDPGGRVKDGTIAAIACLAAFETVSGTSFEATVHVDGLQKLVNMRGGLKKLGMDGFLEQFLYWVDLSNATAGRKKPRFLPFEPTCSDQDALWKYCDSNWDEEFLGDLPFKPFEGLDLVESRLFHRLRQLAHLLTLDSSLPTGTHQKSYTNAVLLLERQIGVAVQERIAFRRKFGGVTLTAPTCMFYIPALIFCYLVLRPIPVRSSIYDQFVVRMKNQLDTLSSRQLFSRFHLEFWLWSLMITGAISVGRPEQSYFGVIVSKLCALLEVRSWDGAKRILREFAWVEPLCERPCKAFWDGLHVM